MKYLIVKVEEGKKADGSPMYKSTLRDTDGKDETINLFDKVGEGMSVEGEIVSVEKNGKTYRNFKSAQKAAGSNYAAAKKEETITKFQDRKTQDIAKAQDRSAWMWAKNNAATLLAIRGEFFANKNNSIIAQEVIDLATKIYNAEPTEPFTSYEKPSHMTSPTPEHPGGIDTYNHPLVSDAERQTMDDIDWESLEKSQF